jgi:hypothetical protein
VRTVAAIDPAPKLKDSQGSLCRLINQLARVHCEMSGAFLLADSTDASLPGIGCRTREELQRR